MAEWNQLSDTLKLRVASSALHQAVESLAVFAETLAAEIDHEDLSGPDMLRLFAHMIRAGTGQSAAAVRGLH